MERSHKAAHAHSGTPCLGFGMSTYPKSGMKFVDKSQVIWNQTGFGQCAFKVPKNPAKSFSLSTQGLKF